MNKDKIELKPNDEQRIRLCTQILGGEKSYEEAATLLALSVRQVRRVVKAFVAEGARGIVHGNRGRPPAHRLDEGTRSRIQER